MGTNDVHSDRSHRQSATYWAPGARDGFGGKAYVAPVSVDCRWMVKDGLFINAAGKEERAEHVVLLSLDVAVDGYLLLGASVAADPKTVAGAREIRAFLKTPNIKNNRFGRRALL